ncbi:hypothetical protein SDRG_09027 [Saprolegnia diclina VS20]|uniref:BZIP domain-containing protein n=1 Tax=Saprolegnia diclina (strain VS20) TaxID=1156394 RepID=T0QII0_SAPDV|nr:hypothetical protein SDRG_09027 [Saprolegnia diclina VS20]EQC33520.1 hypothetical protein SDRG_09027 [Saprolegnia diclina VS20]|eukprot:XP_008613160.1 hypothetical protein SDRG_09027 [Saprolegnia diclina VS20]
MNNNHHVGDLRCSVAMCPNAAHSHGMCVAHLPRMGRSEQPYYMEHSNPGLSMTRPTLSSDYSRADAMSSNQCGTPTSTHSGSDNSEGHGNDSKLRRERNRIAARKSRQRKLDKINHLENEKGRLEDHRNKLLNEIRQLESRMEGSVATTKKILTDSEYEALQLARTRIIEDVHAMYNASMIEETMKYFREDSIVSGPQNSVHLRGKDAIVLDYLCTECLFKNFQITHTRIDCGGPRSQHFRVYWVFTGTIKDTGECMNKEFLDLFRNVLDREVSIDGVSNYSFSGDKIVYIHRTADQAKFLSNLVRMSKQASAH